jgi:hypothetical protein
VHHLSRLFLPLPCWSRWLRLALWVICGLALSTHLRAAHAQGSLDAPSESITLPVFELQRNEEGLVLSFATKFALSASVEDALQKGVPLVFMAQAKVRGERWYWRDKNIQIASRSWRLSYQPLTRKYRVSLGGLAQSYDSLPDALGNLSSAVNWKLSEFDALKGMRVYVEFAYALDTTQLPRPLQIGINGLSDWSLRIERTQRLP